MGDWYMTDLGDRVRAAREQAGLTQVELARRSGVSRHTVVNVESGAAEGTSVGTVVRILGALGLEPALRRRPAAGLRPGSRAYAEAEASYMASHRVGSGTS